MKNEIFKRIADNIFQTYTCYVYENILTERNEEDYLPHLNNFSFQIISTKQQLDDLVLNGFDLSAYNIESWSVLEKGVLAGALFIDKELASLEWVAATEQANRINIYPLKIDFSHNEAYASGVWTNPKYRRKGLHTYVYFRTYDYLREKGIKIVKSIVASDNLAALNAHTRFAPDERIYARARFVSVFHMRFWKETPVIYGSIGRVLDQVEIR
jgi:hypothetical protein